MGIETVTASWQKLRDAAALAAADEAKARAEALRKPSGRVFAPAPDTDQEDSQ